MDGKRGDWTISEQTDGQTDRGQTKIHETKVRIMDQWMNEWTDGWVDDRQERDMESQIDGWNK